MDNFNSYKKIFMDTFALDEDKVNENITMENTELWDSVGHINLVATVEDVFHIEMTLEEMSEFISFEAGIGILRKYGINI